ncbi:hypothetical protein CHS0354_040818 [Potamilus streckersoni]|uniref:Uncharacterized protein n=1 Tax=Potamilus streckersoni TaxID=2493646 RepID=A0AAE0SLR8_9BIVA|nr:hypothetical protein CHS0354_040818 [Potamilus streckersoni]
MGCGGSTPEKKPRMSVTLRRGSIFRRQPKVSLRTGHDVKVLETNPKIIFVFGGPGTKKGKIIDNVAKVYGFKLINMEKTLMASLIKKLENPDPNNITPALTQMLKTHPELLRLDWCLKEIMKYLDDMEKDEVYVIDFLPNLKFLQNNELFTKDCVNEFKQFEAKYPVSFAINFTLPSGRLLKKVEIECAKPPTPTSDQTSPTQPAANTESGAADQVKSQSDEADASRTQKRLALYCNSAKPFIEFFQKSGRLVSVDVSCGLQEVIFSRICDFLLDLHFSHMKVTETVILFVFGDAELDNYHVFDYEMTILQMEQFFEDPTEQPPEKVLQILCKQIDQCHPASRSFVVNLLNTSLTRNFMEKRQTRSIVFVDSSEKCQMSKYFKSFQSSVKETPQLRAVSSLDNEICLFPADINEDSCKWLAGTMREIRKPEVYQVWTPETLPPSQPGKRDLTPQTLSSLLKGVIQSAYSDL